MKVGEFNRFNKFCGICKIMDENDGELYVVYHDYMQCSYTLGSVIGKGKTTEEALIDATKNFNRLVRILEKKISLFSHSLQGFFISESLDKNPILRIKDVKVEIDKDGCHVEVPGDKFVNADVKFDSQGCYLGIA